MSTDDRDGLREVPGARGGEPGDDAILRKGVGESFNGEAACRWRFSDDLLICQRQCNQIRGTEIGSRRRFPVRTGCVANRENQNYTHVQDLVIQPSLTFVAGLTGVQPIVV